MASTAAVTDQAKQDWLNGVNQPGDTYMVALYNPGTLSKSTTAYTSSGEISGTGYTAGGVALSGFTVSLSGDTAYIDWTTDPSWTNSTITASTALIYNATRSNKALAVLTFTSTSSTAGTWTLQLPAPGVTATITLA
jgi:hypothetical protein